MKCPTKSTKLNRISLHKSVLNKKKPRIHKGHRIIQFPRINHKYIKFLTNFLINHQFPFILYVLNLNIFLSSQRVHVQIHTTKKKPLWSAFGLKEQILPHCECEQIGELEEKQLEDPKPGADFSIKKMNKMIIKIITI